MQPAPLHAKQRVSMIRNATITNPWHSEMYKIDSQNTIKVKKKNNQLSLLSLQQSAKTCLVNARPAPFDEEMKETIRTTASNIQFCYKGSLSYIIYILKMLVMRLRRIVQNIKRLLLVKIK